MTCTDPGNILAGVLPGKWLIILISALHCQNMADIIIA